MNRRAPLSTGLALLSAALGGCQSASQPPARPEMAPPPAYRHTGPTAGFATARSADRWWTVFGDPALNALQEAAVAHAPTLQAALAARDAALARREADRSARLPFLTGGAEATLAGESVERTTPTPAGPQVARERGDSYRFPFAAVYELDLWGRVRRLTERADAQVAASEADLAAVRLSLAGDVAAAYFRCRAAEAEVRVLTQRLVTQEQNLALRRARQAGGFTSDLEVARDESELHQLTAELADAHRRLDLERNVLTLLTGRAELPSAVPGISAPPRIPAGVPASLLARRPDLAAAEAQVRARYAEIGLAQAARYPAIQLTAAGGFAGSQLEGAFERPGQFWNLGPSLSVPVFDGGRGAAQVSAATAAARQAEAGFRQQFLVACREVEDALVEERGLAERESAQRLARDAAAEVARLSGLRHELGFASYFEVLAAERTLLELDRALAQLASQRQLAVVRLIRALGGTWDA